VVTQQYSLLFPASATWFSFARDFLHLDFGLSPHVVPYGIQDFTTGLPPQPLWPGNPTREPARFKARRFLRPRFDQQLLARVRNVVVNDEIYISMHRAMQVTLGPDWSRAISIMNVFRGLEVYVIADQLFNICHEDGEELVWIRGQLGDELSSLSLSREYQRGTEFRRELEAEQEYRHLLTDLLLWKRPPVKYSVLDDRDVAQLAREWSINSRGRRLPTVVRKSITTAKIKDALLTICGSEDNFQGLTGLHWLYVRGRRDYKGSLDLSQQLGFLELLLEMTTADIDNNCQTCYPTPRGVRRSEEDVPFLLYRIDMLVLEIMSIQEAEKTAEKKCIEVITQ
jgi:hypothetical protein